MSADPRPVGPFAIALALVLATTDLTPAECDEVDRRLREQPLVPSATGEAVTQVRAVLDAVRAER